MSRHEDDAWNDAPDGATLREAEADAEEPIGSERRGLDNAAAIAAGDACAGCGAYPARCECVEPRDTIETPAPETFDDFVARADGCTIDTCDGTCMTPAPVCSVCGVTIELDPTYDNGEGPLYCEPCHDKVYPS